MMTNRRAFVIGVGTVVSASGIGAAVIQETDSRLVFTEVDDEGEYVVLENRGQSDVDLSGYIIEFEGENEDYDQLREIPDGTVIEAGSSLTFATGAKEVADADVHFDGEGYLINNDGQDVILLLAPDEETVVARSDADTTAETTTETPEATETSEETQTPEETATSEETQTPEGTEDGESTSSSGGSSDGDDGVDGVDDSEEAGDSEETSNSEDAGTDTTTDSDGSSGEESSQTDVDDGC